MSAHEGRGALALHSVHAPGASLLLGSLRTCGVRCATPSSPSAPLCACCRAAHATRRVVVLRCLREACSDGQLLVDLFANYDCDLSASNLFERLINGLVKMAQAPLSASADGPALAQEQWLRQEALTCLSSACGALWTWHSRAAGGQLAAGGDEAAGADA